MLTLDPEIILDDTEDPDPNAEEDYEGYEGYYGEEDEDVGDEAMASDQGQSESSQGRFNHPLNARETFNGSDCSWKHSGSERRFVKIFLLDPVRS